MTRLTETGDFPAVVAHTVPVTLRQPFVTFPVLRAAPRRMQNAAAWVGRGAGMGKSPVRIAAKRWMRSTPAWRRIAVTAPAMAAAVGDKNVASSVIKALGTSARRSGRMMRLTGRANTVMRWK